MIFAEIGFPGGSDKFKMKIKLDDQDAHKYFRFKIGDKVRIRHARLTGTVTAGNCYLDPELSSVFYRVKIQYGSTQTFREGDIELLKVPSLLNR